MDIHRGLSFFWDTGNSNDTTGRSSRIVPPIDILCLFRKNGRGKPYSSRSDSCRTYLYPPILSQCCSLPVPYRLWDSFGLVCSKAKHRVGCAGADESDFISIHAQHLRPGLVRRYIIQCGHITVGWEYNEPGSCRLRNHAFTR